MPEFSEAVLMIDSIRFDYGYFLLKCVDRIGPPADLETSRNSYESTRPVNKKSFNPSRQNKHKRKTQNATFII